MRDPTDPKVIAVKTRILTDGPDGALDRACVMLAMASLDRTAETRTGLANCTQDIASQIASVPDEPSTVQGKCPLICDIEPVNIKATGTQ